jgi:murein L,D-transpeptidase YafK
VVASGWGEGAVALSVREPRIVVLKSRRALHLFDGKILVRSYSIDLGSDPHRAKTRRGDDRTPVGRFHVASKNPDSPYHRFLGIDYPNAEAVLLGAATGLISLGEMAAILDDLTHGRCPDWSTALGGGVGIHGRGRGTDWTAGCIALADRHVEELFEVLRVGDSIEILP